MYLRSAGAHRDQKVALPDDIYINRKSAPAQRLVGLTPACPIIITCTCTHTGASRVDGNKKGVMTRQRQPKAAARMLRQRYLSLAMGLQAQSCADFNMLGFLQKKTYVN